MNSGFKVFIPARYASTRLKGKLLLEIAGKPLIQHVYESAAGSAAEEVIIATDDERIMEAVTSYGGIAVMTDPGHKSGTDRIAEAVKLLEIPDETIIVNVQGDIYGCHSAIIDQLARILQNRTEIPMATLCEKMSTRDALVNPNLVKVVINKHNHAVYFSRSPIPWSNPDMATFPCTPYLHVGIYAYRVEFLQNYAALPQCPLEESEKLEQLRALYHGYSIYVQEACGQVGIGVDTAEDLEKARRMAETTV